MIQKSARKSVAVDVTTEGWAHSPTISSNRPFGIHCNAATTITAKLSDDATATSWVLPAGFSPYSFVAITTASTTKTGFRILYE